MHLNLRVFEPQRRIKWREPISQVRDCYCGCSPVAHGLAHLEGRVGLAPSGLIFVIVVVLIVPLIATGLVWTAEKRLGLILLSLSMFGSLLFGLYNHFMILSKDHVRLQPSNSWRITFVLTAYSLLITEAMGTYVGVQFLRIAKGRSH